MRKRQYGATLWGNILIILIAVTVGILVVKLSPIYVDSFTVKGAVDALAQEENIAKMKDRQILEQLQKHFIINNVRNFNMENVVMEREKTRLVAINVDYEVREHLFYNIDVVLSFKNRLEVQ